MTLAQVFESVGRTCFAPLKRNHPVKHMHTHTHLAFLRARNIFFFFFFCLPSLLCSVFPLTHIHSEVWQMLDFSVTHSQRTLGMHWKLKLNRQPAKAKRKSVNEKNKMNYWSLAILKGSMLCWNFLTLLAKS